MNSAATVVGDVVVGTMERATAAVSAVGAETVDLASAAMARVRSSSKTAAGRVRTWLPPVTMPSIEFMSKIHSGPGLDVEDEELLRQKRIEEMMSFRLQHQDQDQWGYILPDELILLIFCNLAPADVVRAGAVCKHWHFLSTSEVLWKHLFDRDWNSSEHPLPPVPKWKKQRAWKQRYLDNLRLRRNWRDGIFTMWKMSSVDPSCIGVSIYGSTVWCLQASIELGLVATGCDDGVVRMWDLGFASCINNLEGHTGVVYSLDFNETQLCSGSEDQTIRVWQTSTGDHLFTLDNDGTEARSLRLCGSDKLVVGGDDGAVRVWSLETRERLHVLQGHTAVIKGLSVWGNQKVVSASEDHNLRVWDIESGECLQTLRGHTEGVRCVDIHRDIAVSGSADTTIHVWDLKAGVCLRKLVGHKFAVQAIQVHGDRIVTGSEDRTIKIWDVNDIQCKHNLIGHTDEVLCLQFDAERIVSASVDESIRIWDFTVHTDADVPANAEGPYSFWS